ncbi:MAG: hypothetical protein B0D86_00145 [Candidatus Sedimenticola endophacoides]|nr:MAG: hypothetical protein B0D86_00145 [Candidatus Sedimenticola endophacoides]
MTEHDEAAGGMRAETIPFLPDFCNVRTLFAVVILAELLAIVLALNATPRLEQFASELSLYSLYVMWIALLFTALLCLLGRDFSRRGPGTAGLLAWLVLLAVTAAVALLADTLSPQTDGDHTLLLRSLVISAIIGALLLRHFYIQYLWKRQIRAESQARFQALQSRIRPHFLFNSMNTIANLTRSDPVLAEGVVEDLSDLFRASLGDAARPARLDDELELCRRYLRIESLRLGGRLRVEWDLHGDLPLWAPLPPLILQPLVENAVYHGIEPALQPGLIRISGRYRRGRVNLGISNSLPGEGARGGSSVFRENKSRLQ